MNTQVKYIIAKCSGFATSLTPMAIYIGVNWEKYAPTTQESVKLSFGCLLMVFFTMLLTLNKIKAPKMCVVLGVLFGISFLVNSIMQDFMWVCGTAFAGSLADEGIYQLFTKQLESDLEYEKTKTSEKRYQEKENKKMLKAEKKLKELENKYNL